MGRQAVEREEGFREPPQKQGVRLGHGAAWEGEEAGNAWAYTSVLFPPNTAL